MGFKNRAMIYEIISEFGFSDKHIDELIKLAESENGKYIQSPVTGTRIIKFNHWFIVSAQPSSFSETFIVEEGVKNVQCSMFHVQCSILESSNFKPQTSNLKLQTSNSTASLDAGLISYPLIIRKWKQGDYFYPLGMKKKKKLARFFIDQKLSKTQKENAWIIEMNKKIIWVVGNRIDERFKITDKTRSVLKISFINGQIE